MSDIIIYLLKVILIQGFFFLFYWLVLRKTAFHSLNRLFLLGAMGLAFVIPFIELSSFQPHVPEVVQDSPIVIWLAEPTPVEEWTIVPVKNEVKLTLGSVLPWAYGLFTLVLLVRSLIYLSALEKLKRKSETIKKRWFTLYRTSQSHPFSFFSNVFMPRTLFGSGAFDQVLAHECVHVRRFHSVDRLVLDFVVSLFWFNPFIYLYRNALIEIHEYQADEGVLRRYDPVEYQEVLFSQLRSPQYSGLVSHFNVQMIKKRIVMMNKQKKRTGWIYALTVPVTLMVVFAFSSKEAMKPLNDVGNEITSFIGPIGDVKEYATTYFEQDNEPSILPFKESANIRMSSNYGMRMHPITKERKMHSGVDFACQSGTAIIATADGTVSEIQNKVGEGYGKMMVLNHGDGFQTRYAQLSQFKARQGQTVTKGDVIALSGNSGASTAPHLHYEVIKDGKAVNPALYIKNYQFTIKEIPKVKEVEKAESNRKSKQEQLQKEQELAQVKAELVQREKELVLAKEQLQEMEEEEKRMKEEILFQDQNGKPKIRIDGSGSRSLSSKDQPLFVVDGEIVNRESLSKIDPNDIESINVLKDEKATDKYDGKGETGVVEIYLKDSKKRNKLKEKDKTKSKEKIKEKQGAYRVIIDPGHGGKDFGTTSFGLNEKEIVLEVAKKIRDHFVNHENIEIVYTRESDDSVDLLNRSNSTAMADMLVSLHIDFDKDESKQFTGLFLDSRSLYYEESLALSKVFKNEIEENGREVRLGVSNFFLLKSSQCPSVLIELGFLSNSSDAMYLSSDEGKEFMASRIAKSIEKGLKTI